MENGIIDRLETATKLAAATKCGLTKIPTMDAQALLLTLNQQEKVIESLKSDLRETLDVVTRKLNVVRCKDCKYYRATPGYCAYDRIWQENKGHIWGMYCKPDWFCADGERKDT